MKHKNNKGKIATVRTAYCQCCDATFTDENCMMDVFCKLLIVNGWNNIKIDRWICPACNQLPIKQLQNDKQSARTANN